MGKKISQQVRKSGGKTSRHGNNSQAVTEFHGRRSAPAVKARSPGHRHLAMIFLFSLLVIVCWPALAAADDGKANLEEIEARIAAGPAIADLLAFALRGNPSIEAARQGWKAEVEGYRVAKAYPDPRISAFYPVETRIGEEEWGVTLSQGIPFPGRLSAEGDVASADISIARIAYEQAIRDVVIEVRQAAHELFYLQEAGKIAAGNRELMGQVMASGTAAYARDRASLIDLSKAAAQSGQLQFDEHLLAELAATEKTRLNSLLGRSPATVIGTLTAPPLRFMNHSLEELYLFAEESRSEILLARAALEKSERGVTVARYRTLPEFDVGVFVNSIKEADPLDDNGRTGVKEVGATVSLSMPIWFGKNQGQMDSARARAEQARSEVRARINEARAEVSRLFFRLRNAERLVRLYRDELIPQAAKTVETAENWFRQGKGSLSDFTETRTVWYNFQLALARATADYGQNLAALEGLAGRTLTESAAQTSPVAPAAEEGKP